jgi:Raf kinase inhibitor-like YbhB/YbcL family protein
MRVLKDMKKIFLFIIVLAIVILLPDSCKNENGNDIKTFYLYSKAFADNGKIPVKYCEKSFSGKNISISLGWKNPPRNTKSFAILMIDNHPMADKFIHWLAINIPKKTSSIDEKASITGMPSGSVEFDNSFGYKGYGGPSPQAGTGTHRYLITLYALNTDFMDEFAKNDSLYFDYDTVSRILDKYTIEKTELTGICGK